MGRPDRLRADGLYEGRGVREGLGFSECLAGNQARDSWVAPESGCEAGRGEVGGTLSWPVRVALSKPYRPRHRGRCREKSRPKHTSYSSRLSGKRGSQLGDPRPREASRVWGSRPRKGDLPIGGEVCRKSTQPIPRWQKVPHLACESMPGGGIHGLCPRARERHTDRLEVESDAAAGICSRLPLPSGANGEMGDSFAS